MKNIEIINLNMNLPHAFAGAKYPFKLVYAIDENTDRLSRESKKIWKAIEGMQSEELKAALAKSTPIHEEQMKSAAYQNTDGTASERAAFLSLKPSKPLLKEFDEFVKKREDALNEEVDFEFYKVSVSIVEQLDFNTWQMGMLKRMLKDDEGKSKEK